ncbi:MAG: SDR family NAD(P)-dependent oxidoreductase [Proteobacteria bacterium]|nr:SDR family NAD(P)-dependent oxidoreductase [Pseudomonadota bacterium]
MVEVATSMDGKVCMVTGANSGIGKATSLRLARMGAAVVMVCRNRQLGESARLEIQRESPNGEEKF